MLLLPWLALPAELPPGPAWPPPPAEPSIVFRKSITGPAELGVKPAPLQRLANWLAGTPQTAADFIQPFGLALDEAGNLLVTDTGANAVCWLDRARKRCVRWEQVGKTHFVSPVAAARQADTFFVADSGLGKVLAFDEQGSLKFEITRELARPSGLAILQDQLFIADAQRHQVVICDLQGRFRGQFGQRGSGPGEFNFPTHVAAAADGRLYVTDSLNGRIQVFDGTGRFERAIGSPGDGPGHFSRPKGVAVDQAGHVYVVDAVFDNVQVFDQENRLLLDWGETGSDAGQFWLPNAIVIDRNNTIYVADAYNHRIQVFQSTGRP